MTARRRGDHLSQRGGVISSLIGTVAVVLILFVLYLARHPIFRILGEVWVVEDTLERADALIILSDDNYYADRATRAAQLYRQGLAPTVVASGKRLRPYAGIAELMEHDLVERGVPKDKILRVAHDADNTREEAQALAKIIAQKKWHEVIVVTSNYHTRRARYIFSHILPPGIKVRITGAADGDFDPQRWWEKRISVKELFREIAGMVVAVWEQHVSAASNPRTQGIVGVRTVKTLEMV
jgi:uncharacterized SAM-binding protein YcdF (DUF218 family)